MAPARCLDITRLISRLGRSVFTGVDRVELAYLRRLLADDDPFFVIARTWLGHILLDRTGAAKALRRIEGQDRWGQVDLLGRLQRKAHPLKQRAEADLRRWALARCRKGKLPSLLAAHLPAGTVYISVGHSNLRDENLAAWQAHGKVVVLVHDMIPLDFPDFQRPGTVGSFELRMRRVARHADLVLCISAQTQDRVQHWFGAWGRSVETTVAHIGVDVPPASEPLPTNMTVPTPYFLAVGTIEPRKNHRLLLDIWDELADTPNPPHLVIAGSRGWQSQDLFQRLDKSPLKDRLVHERPGLSDAQLAGLTKNARALLFPSFAEGFGLPPVEALALGTPVVCSDLPVLREILGNCPIYANASDMYLWKQTVLALAKQDRANEAGHAGRNQSFHVPTWEEHFNHVLRMI